MINNRIISQFKEEGNLRKYGYTVSVSPYNMSDTQRQLVLKRIIKDGKMSIHEIEMSLKMLIMLNQNASNHKDAVKKWKKDLAFVEQQYDDGSIQLTINDFS